MAACGKEYSERKWTLVSHIQHDVTSRTGGPHVYATHALCMIATKYACDSAHTNANTNATLEQQTTSHYIIKHGTRPLLFTLEVDNMGHM